MCLSPYHGCSRSRARLWCGGGGARAFSWLGLGRKMRWWPEFHQLYCCQNSGLLLGSHLTKCQQWQLPLHLSYTPCPWVTSMSLDQVFFPGPGHPRSSANLCHGLNRARVFAWLGLGRRQQLWKTTLHPAWEQTSTHTLLANGI